MTTASKLQDRPAKLIDPDAHT